MKIHEYQAKAILAKYDVPVPRGEVAYTVEEADAAAKKLGGNVVVKAQIHAGGRGKGGGVKIAKSPEEAAERAAQLLGKPLITRQTGPEGKIVHKVLVEQGLDIAKEYYLGIVLDRQASLPVIMASSEGGMDIETLAKNKPESILRVHVGEEHLLPYQARRIAFGLGLPAESINKGVQFITKLFELFVEKDASLAEVNP